VVSKRNICLSLIFLHYHNVWVVEGQTHDTHKPSPDWTHEKPTSTLSVELAPVSNGGSLRVGSTFRFRLTVLQASHVPSDYADIFCQFKWVVAAINK